MKNYRVQMTNRVNELNNKIGTKHKECLVQITNRIWIAEEQGKRTCGL